MISVGIRELKQRASELVRMVRENGSEIQVTYHGKVVALLVPVESKAVTPQETETWTNVDNLAREIEKVRIEAGLSVEELLLGLREQRERYVQEKYGDAPDS
jgi:prevent-host-death family protein